AMAFGWHDEPDHEFFFADFLRGNQAVPDFIHRLHLPINLGRADTHASDIQVGIRAPEDDGTAVFVEGDVIAMRPNTRETFEIGFVIALAALVVPELDRHGRNRLGADQFAFFVDYGFAGLVEGLGGHTKHRALDFAPAHR